MSQSAATHEVRVGVIGIGRQWTDRYRAALTRPGGRARVVAICDPVAHRAEAEADRIGCDAVEGITLLIDRPDVEVVFLLDPTWFGLWPLRVALDRGKPLFSALGHRATLDELSRLDPDRSPGAVVMTDLTDRFAPAMLRLRELLATELGPAHRVLAKGFAATADPERRVPDPRSSEPIDAAIGLIDRCRALMQVGPIDTRLVRKSDRPGRRGRVVSVRFPQGTTARLSLVCDPRTQDRSAETGVKLFVQTHRGHARIDRSGLLHWAIGSHEVEEPRSTGSATSLMVDHVLRRVRGEQSLAPDLAELRDLEQSSRVFEW